jgi:ATP phosphoribosyltransferase
VSEAIVDLVATGRTLQDNGLVAIEDLFHSTARLIGHPLALRLDDGRLQSLVENLKAVGPGATAPAANPVGTTPSGVLAAGASA